MYYLYREEGTLYNYYKFLKIRWVGYSNWSATSSDYLLEYDVILWDTGDISLHMITVPYSYNNGTYSLSASSTYTYSVSSSNPDVTFKKTDSGFEVINSIIGLMPPFERRYLVRSGSIYYTVVDSALSEISVSELTSETFLNYGLGDVPTISLLLSLDNPELLYWQDSDNDIERLIVYGTPQLPQFIYYEASELSEHGGIQKIQCVASSDVMFSVSVDGGSTWKYFDNVWKNTTSDLEGMNIDTFKLITMSQWSEVLTTSTCKFRCALTSVDSNVSNIYIKYTDK